jgi:16S rRNA (guanine966-N2)-methyltransferase
VAAEVLAADATTLPPGPPCALAFFDPPYGQGLVPRAIAAARAAGRLTPDALLVAEFGREETAPELDADVLAERTHGAARLAVLRGRGGS